MSIPPILLATDLDRTLLPNGPQLESPEARPLFRRFAAHAEVKLVYVSGRHQALVQAAIAEYDLPQPDFVIGDVGSSLYPIDAQQPVGLWAPIAKTGPAKTSFRPFRRGISGILPKKWAKNGPARSVCSRRLQSPTGCQDRPLEQEWQAIIGQSWPGHRELASRLAGLAGLHLQEADKQGPYKLSYYAPALESPVQLLAHVRARLAGIRCNLIWSVDETSATGLLDVLPHMADKLHALDYLRQRLGIPLVRTVFAGDSGNDLDVLASEIPAVLVANALASVRETAVAQATANGHAAALHLARGGLAGMNGHYAAGILEGVVHFIPETRAWLTA